MIGINGKLNVVVVDDDPEICNVLKGMLEDKCNVQTVQDASSALKVSRESPLNAIFLDLTLPDQNGMVVLREVRENDPSCEIVVVTGDNSVDTAVEAMKNGAYDYITKPFDQRRVLDVVEKIEKRMQSSLELDRLRSEIERVGMEDEIIGTSDSMAKVFQAIKSTASSDDPVLITGEIGTGKELVARTIHKESQQCQGPFVVVPCGEGSDEHIERDLFGYQKGAFSAAKTTKRGKLELANGGTIFLDEINKARTSLQTRIFRFMKDGTFVRKGGTAQRKTHVRLIASASEDLLLEVHAGLFREDLYHLLKVITIDVPNLKARGRDIHALAKHFVKAECRRRNKTVRGLNGKVIHAFMKYSWPGNIRELKNICERLVTLAQPGELVDVDRLPPEIYTGVARGRKIPGVRGKLEYDERLYDVVNRFEADYIYKVLKKYNWNQSHAARVLGIHRNTLLLKLKQLRIPVERRRRRPFVEA